MTRAIAPKAMNNREGFKMLRPKGKKGFCEGKGRVDDEMKSYERNSRFLVKPLEVMFRSDLDGSRFCEGEVCGWAIEWAMKELIV